MSARDWDATLQAILPRFTGPGVVPVETLQAHSGLELLRAMLEGRLPRPPIADVLNFCLIDVERGRVVFQGTPKFEHYNPIGSVHGGWASTLLDSCMAWAVHSMLQAGKGYTTVELKVNLVRSLSRETGPVRAEGKVIHAGRTTATAQGSLFGPDGKLYAHATTTCLILEGVQHGQLT